MDPGSIADFTSGFTSFIINYSVALTRENYLHSKLLYDNCHCASHGGAIVNKSKMHPTRLLYIAHCYKVLTG